MCDPERFCTEHVGRGATVLVLGRPAAWLYDGLSRAAGPTGLVVVGGPAPIRAPGVAAIRTLPAVTSVLSHAVDTLVMTDDVEGTDPSLLADECRRLLAPGGALRALMSGGYAHDLAGALRRASFRDILTVACNRSVAIGARGPR